MHLYCTLSQKVESEMVWDTPHAPILRKITFREQTAIAYRYAPIVVATG